MAYAQVLDLRTGKARADLILRTIDGAYISADPASTDWQGFQAWTAAGNTPTPAPAPSPAAVDEVPMWAMQAALQVAGKYAAINQAVTGWQQASDPNEVAAYFAWTMGNYATRGSTFIATFAVQFGLTGADIDALFTSASKIAGASA